MRLKVRNFFRWRWVFTVLFCWWVILPALRYGVGRLTHRGAPIEGYLLSIGRESMSFPFDLRMFNLAEATQQDFEIKGRERLNLIRHKFEERYLWDTAYQRYLMYQRGEERVVVDLEGGEQAIFAVPDTPMVQLLSMERWLLATMREGELHLFIYDAREEVVLETFTLPWFEETPPTVASLAFFYQEDLQRIFILHKNQLYLYDRTTQTWQDFPYHLVAKHLMKEHQFSLSQGYLGVYTQDNGLAFLHLDTRNIRNVSFDIEQKDLVQAVWINEDYFILIYEDKKKLDLLTDTLLADWHRIFRMELYTFTGEKIFMRRAMTLGRAAPNNKYSHYVPVVYHPTALASDVLIEIHHSKIYKNPKNRSYQLFIEDDRSLFPFLGFAFILLLITLLFWNNYLYDKKMAKIKKMLDNGSLP
ncbi:hypothetical protein [Entomospira culicis]|uniref:Uncharacterized protein n=1 Tax=Entomospira culicis TaxID=2719989 RepID=A0A968KUB9_9SPIO|nr:hypothetical protein [Entomospira culicis]NIZ19180.1 hypothetical protein [Entomospira culicis]NIZ69394.1 hypothetical protein [Entomospira culicis]WDI36511.1 hypothetical protein PVA46_04090 [Entomospira culicis]WDI38137.1 hypothetical protein PVA47_04090 [Entomospira culicis]